MNNGNPQRPEPRGDPDFPPECPEPFDIRHPRGARAPLVVASPHSGDCYPESFQAQARVRGLALRRSEDAFVDELFAAAPDLGAPLLRALFPRAFVDVNREAYELDPAMFTGDPEFHLIRSPRVAAGLGSIPRVIGDGQDIYAEKMSYEEAERRIDRYYRPYHRALEELIEETTSRFGYMILIDAHSMPSRAGALATDPALRETHFILGDRHGLSCASVVIDTAEAKLAKRGYRVLRNHPYAGGYTTEHYGRPEAGVHVLQIEVNRASYMNETTLEKSPGFAAVANDLTDLLSTLSQIDRSTLIPR